MDLVGVISDGSTGTVEDLVWKDTTNMIRQRDFCGLSNLIGPVVPKSACVPVFLACHKFDISYYCSQKIGRWIDFIMKTNY
jgi:hypothetical protein